MLTMQEQIKNASFAYITMISKTRFQVYMLRPNEQYIQQLFMLWPSEGEKLLRHQTSSKVNHLPKYHFRLIGYGYDKSHAIAKVLTEINPNISVLSLADGFIS